MNHRYRSLLVAGVAAIGLASAIACSSSSDTIDNNPTSNVQSATTPTGCYVNGTPYQVIDNQLWTYGHPSTMAFTIAPGDDRSNIYLDSSTGNQYVIVDSDAVFQINSDNSETRVVYGTVGHPWYGGTDPTHVPGAPISVQFFLDAVNSAGSTITLTTNMVEVLWAVNNQAPSQSPVVIDGGSDVGPFDVPAPAACIIAPINPANYDPSCGHVSSHNLHTCAQTNGLLPCVVGDAPIPASVDGGAGILPDGALVSNDTTYQNTCAWTNVFGTEIAYEVAYTTVNGFLVECNAGACVGNTPPPPPPPPIHNVPTFPNPGGDVCLIGQTQYERLALPHGHGEFLFQVVNGGAGIQPVQLPVTYVDANGNQYVVINGLIYQVNADGSQTEVMQLNGQPQPLSFLSGDTRTFEGLALSPDGIPLACEGSCQVNAKIDSHNHHILTPSGYGYHFEDTGVTLDGNYWTKGPNTGITNPNRIGVQSCNYDNDGDVESCQISFLVIDGRLYLETGGQQLVETNSSQFCCSDEDNWYGSSPYNHTPDGWNGFQP